jgi:hypothetical protein
VIAVPFPHGGRLQADVERLGSFGLHTESNLRGLDSAFQLLILPLALHVHSIQPPQQVQLAALLFSRQIRILDVCDQLLCVALFQRQIGSLMNRGQKGGTPQLMPDHRYAGTKHDKARQVLVLRSQPISNPGAHRRPPRQAIAGIQHKQRRFMIRPLRMHGANHAQIVGVLGQLRKDIADFDTALPVRLKRERRTQQVSGLPLRP